MKIKAIDISSSTLEMFKCLVEQFEIADTKRRSMALLNTKPGFQTWYSSHYGYPLIRDLFVIKRTREFSGVERVINDAVESAGIGTHQVIMCSLDGVTIRGFSDALLDVTCPPVMLFSTTICKKGYVLNIAEDHEYWFSADLWEKLRIKTNLWIEPKKKK